MTPRSPLERRYGHGAARVPLLPPQRRMRLAPRSLRQGLRARRREDPESITFGRNALRALPGLATTALVLSWLFAALLTRAPEDSGVRIVPFEPPPPVEVAAVEIPEPEALPPEPQAPEPEMEIPEPQIAQAPEPPPAPEPIARPTPPPPPAPRPQIERIARRPAPPPPEPSRRPRPETARPAAPLLTLDAVAVPEPSEPARAEPVRRPVAFAAVTPSAPRPTLTAPGAALPRPAPPPSRSARSQPLRQSTRTPPLAVNLAAPTPPPASPGPRPDPRRQARRAPATPAPRRRSRERSVALDLPTSGASGGPELAPPAAPAPRSERPAAASAAASDRTGDPGLPGVALGSLNACVSPRAEDALKQKLIASVGNRIQCESSAGRYHFVQTRNLNAFLMRIERAPRRKPADRCAELGFALDCLSRTEEER